MSDSQLREDILFWLGANARGNQNAKPRKTTLLPYLCLQGHWPTPNDTSDRALRKFKETMPEVGSCLRGYYLIVTAEDRRIAQGQLESHGKAELHRASEIRKAVPTGQLGLWEG